METKNNSGTDIDVLTSFQPMPKRFMVWHKKRQSFIEWGGERILDLYNLSNLLDCYSSIDYYEDVIVVQSTNLFDKDGKEIFEGSIVEWEESRWMVLFNQSHLEFVLKPLSIHKNYLRGLQSMSLKMSPNIKVIGHALSNPELLEDENV